VSLDEGVRVMIGFKAEILSGGKACSRIETYVKVHRMLRSYVSRKEIIREQGKYLLERGFDSGSARSSTVDIIQ